MNYRAVVKQLEVRIRIELFKEAEPDGRWIADIDGLRCSPVYGKTKKEAIKRMLQVAKAVLRS